MTLLSAASTGEPEPGSGRSRLSIIRNWVLSRLVVGSKYNYLGDMPYIRQFVPPRRRLTRWDVVRLIEAHGTADGIDLAASNLDLAFLSSSPVRMPALDGAVFGAYGNRLSKTTARRAFFNNTSLKRVKFVYADLVEANFCGADLTEADLRFANMSHSELERAQLCRSNLYGARFEGASLAAVNLRGADLFKADLSGAKDLQRQSLGDRILEEDASAYRAFVIRALLPDSKNPLETHLSDRVLKGVQIYEHLRSCFEQNGNHQDAVWAYLRGRRLRKSWHFRLAWRRLKALSIFSALNQFFHGIADWIVELLCNYGESIWRVFGVLALLLLAVGPVLVFVTGGLRWDLQSAADYWKIESPVLRSMFFYVQYVLYVLDTLTTADFSKLEPANLAVQLASGVLAMAGVFLAGLLGFVAGNRIRSS